MRVLAAIAILMCIPVVSVGQDHGFVVSGSVVDTTGTPLNTGTTVVVMTRIDSLSLKWVYTDTANFTVRYHNPERVPVMVYISCYGFKSCFMDLDGSPAVNLGHIVLRPVESDIDEVTVIGEAKIRHSFNGGRDEFEIPQSLGEREFDLNSLLSYIPGLEVMGGAVTIVGRGSPVYTINGLAPRPGELQSLGPRDIKKIIIDRMPSAKYDQSVVGIIDIVTRKKLSDYLSMRLGDDFSYSVVPINTASININHRDGRWTNYLGYNHSYGEGRSSSQYNYSIYDDVVYTKHSHIDRQGASSTHSLTISPKYEINENDFVDLQFSLNSMGQSGWDLTKLDFYGVEKNTTRGQLDADITTTHLVIRYVNKTARGSSLSISLGYLNSTTDGGKRFREDIQDVQGNHETIDTELDTKATREVITFSGDYETSLGRNIKLTAGTTFGELKDRGDTDYLNGVNYRTDTEQSQASLYLNLGHSIGQLTYQLGGRAEYLYVHDDAEDVNKRPFSFLPMASISYSFNDHVTGMLYFRRYSTYPSMSQIDPIVIYVNRFMNSRGNPNLKPSRNNELFFRLSLPYNLSFSATYLDSNDEICQVELVDEDPRHITLTYINFSHSRTLESTIAWGKWFGPYYISANGTYMQDFSSFTFLDEKYENDKPCFRLHCQQMFRFTPLISLNLTAFYQTDQQKLFSTNAWNYGLNASLSISLMDRKLNIIVQGNNLLHRDWEGWTTYDRISSHNRNFEHQRTFRIGITYNFNNFRDLFRKNSAATEILNRVQ